MNVEWWPVIDARGKELGTVCRLIIDARTREITYAEVAIPTTYKLVRLPWSAFEVTNDTVVLNATKEQLSTLPAMNGASELSERLTMVVENNSAPNDQLELYCAER